MVAEIKGLKIPAAKPILIIERGYRYMI